MEPIAEEEICTELGGEIKRRGNGFVVFRVAEIDDRLLRLRTTEDVFLLAWGTDGLSYRAADLKYIQRWTAREADWSQLQRLHHAVHPKPKGKPTYRLVTQMAGKHAYRRVDAHEALAKGLAGKIPQSWQEADENAAFEVWLTIDGKTAVCGVRLSDRTMRHRTYKVEHLPASLRPTVAAAMVRLARPQVGETMLDPMCGAGTILAEARQAQPKVRLMGGDLDRRALRAASLNLRRMTPFLLARWDATRLPLPDSCVDAIVSNPPFGKQLGEPDDIKMLYHRMVIEYNRVLKPEGRVVLLVADRGALMSAVKKLPWHLQREFSPRILGQIASLLVWRKHSPS